MRRVLLLAAAAGLLVIPCGGPAGAAGTVSLTVQPESRSVRLGDEIALRLTLDNGTAEPVELPHLRLASDAVSIAVSGPDVRATTVTRLFGEFEESGGVLRLAARRTALQLLPPGGQVTGEIRVPAVAAGTLRLAVSLARGDAAPLAPEPVEVEVTAPSNAGRLSARVETTAGAFVIDLDGARAFDSVGHLWALANAGFYQDLPFHRLLPGILVQTGDPRGDGTGTCGWYVPSEADDTPLERGVVALARGAHADSASSQWFVTLGEGERANERLAGAFTVLGRVVEGLEVVDALAATDPAAGPPRVVRIRTMAR